VAAGDIFLDDGTGTDDDVVAGGVIFEAGATDEGFAGGVTFVTGEGLLDITGGGADCTWPSGDGFP
jgi:hypothetical protein